MKPNYERTKFEIDDLISFILLLTIILIVSYMVRYCGTKFPQTAQTYKVDSTLTLDEIQAPYGFVDENASEEFKQAVIQHNLKKQTKSHE